MRDTGGGSGRRITACFFALALMLSPARPLAQAAPRVPVLTDAQMEDFLRKARIVAAKPVGTGITESLRATLTDSTLTHDAHIQIVDVFKKEFQTKQGIERDFRDSWQYNVAAYKLDRLLDLRLVPVSVARRWQGEPGAFTWWVDDVLMDEGMRLKTRTSPPNSACWLQQTQALRMFDALIANTDRNLGNTLIGGNWRIWAIDHTRAFRLSPQPASTEGLTSIDPVLLEKLVALDFKTLQKAIGAHLDDAAIRKLLSRRDALVAHYRSLPASALVPRADPALGCGT